MFNKLSKFISAAVFLTAVLMLGAENSEAFDAGWCGTFFIHYPIQGDPHQYCSSPGSERGVHHALPNGLNDEFSTMLINPNSECVVTEDSDFDGRSLLIQFDPRYPNPVHLTGYGSTKGIADEIILANSGSQIRLNDFGWNDTISSIHCNQKGHFNPENISGGKVELYKHAYFGGERIPIEVVDRDPRDRENTLWFSNSDYYLDIGPNNSWNDSISSLRMGHDVSCVFYTDANRGGLTAAYGHRFNAVRYQYPDFESTSQAMLNDNISAIACWRN